MVSTAPAAPFDIAVLDSLAAAGPIWRELETRAVFTPYQRFDWLEQLQAAGGAADSRLAIAVLRTDGVVIALIPLALHRRLGLRVASMMGTAQSNTDWIIAEPGFMPDAGGLTTIFKRIAEQVGVIDLLEFHNMPASWNGAANPLLQLPHSLAASNFYFTSIEGVEKPFIDTRLAPKRRGDLRRSRRRMEEAMGDVRLVRVADAVMLDRAHAAFLDQRSTRFDEMGIDNIFLSDLFRRFFRDAAMASFGSERPVILVHALVANEQITATCWGTTAGDHYALYINSTDTGDASRFSLMSILIADLMDELLDMGIKTFDIGLGDFSYKGRWTEPQPVYDSLVPLSPAGRLAAVALTGRTAVKRTIKQNPRLWEAATRVRRVLHRLRPQR